ncbi:MAG TPA: hypothetical protein DEO32_03865 [Ruminococcaceae bacterium]|nr:hypothetical protein [Oscillospiraceae bacterium]
MYEKSENNINSLIQSLSQKLNTTPEQLNAAANSGNLSEILKSSQNPQADKVSEILKDPERTKEILQSPQAQRLMKLFDKK